MLHKPPSAENLTQQLAAAYEAARFADSNRQWHIDRESALAEDDLLLALHRSNFDLWHEEDRARDPAASDIEIAQVKRSIDRINQRRNDLVELVDATLLRNLVEASLPKADAPLHSETPGLILDRLSILSLKIFHTTEETMRPDANRTHIDRNRERLAVLQQQSSDLVGCLQDLWTEVCHGERRFRLYRQMKMYNDPELNPVLYGARRM